MKPVDRIQKLLRNANAIRDSVAKWSDVYTKDSSFDKLGFQFNEDSRFAACDALHLQVDSWKGTYGSSSCTSILSVDRDVFNEHLLKVLRGRFWELLKETEQSIRDEAREYKEAAKRELSDGLQALEAL